MQTDYLRDEASYAFETFVYKNLTPRQKYYVLKNSRGNILNVLPLTVFVKTIQHLRNTELPKSKVISDRQLECIRSSYYVGCPQAGTKIGIPLAQTYLQKRQQSNLNIKHLRNSDGDGQHGEYDDNIMYSDPVYIDEIASIDKDKNNVILADGVDMTTDTLSTNEIIYMAVYIDRVADYKRLLRDKILKYVMCINIKEERKEKVYMIIYFKAPMFGTFVTVFKETFPSMGVIFTNQKKMCKDNVFYIVNFTVFLFWILTDKFIPIVETPEEDMLMHLLHLMAIITFLLGKNSIKRTGLSKAGFTPWNFLVSEAGLFETFKYMNSYNRDPSQHVINIEHDIMGNISLNLPVMCGTLTNLTNVQEKDV